MKEFDSDFTTKMPILQNLQLTTFEGTRDFYASIIEAFNNAEISENNLRAFVYALKGYLDYWKLTKDLELEKRLEALEEMYNKEGK